VRTYLRGRASLRRTCILVDARHGLKDVDRDFMAMLADAAVAFQLVLTKADQVGQAELADLVGSLGQELERRLGAHPDLVVTSAHKGTGIEALRAELAALAVAPEAAAGEAGS
jgi:GTP-binding protein